MKDKKEDLPEDLNVRGIAILYLVACLAGLVHVWVGVTAFICITVLVMMFVWTFTHRKGED